MVKSGYRRFFLTEKEQINEDIYKIKIAGRFSGNPGQFYMLRFIGQDPLLPRPLSICDLDEEGITFLFQKVGRGTAMLSQMSLGSPVELLGPLGNGFKFNDSKERIALIAGGIGIAPFLYVAKQMPNPIELFAGFRSTPYFLEEFKPYVDALHVATEDGSQGTKGYVTKNLDLDRFDLVLACGPNVMLQSLQGQLQDKKAQFSMESHMACVSAQFGCNIETTSECSVFATGPIFDAKEVLFNAWCEVCESS